MILDQSDDRSPYFPVYDHRIPRKEGDLVLCASFVNAMKGSFSDREFEAAVGAPARHLAGESFHRDEVEFWYRTRIDL